MRKNFGAKPYLYPQPVLIVGSYDAQKPDAMNAAWGGISDSAQITMCRARPQDGEEHFGYRAFTVSMATSDQVVACDYVGMASEIRSATSWKAGWHTTKSSFVNAPLIDELPMALECRLVSYDAQTCCMIGEIVNVSADGSVLDEKGNIDPAKLRPITFDAVNGTYLALGEKVGNAFSDGRQRM
ncbi:MAG: flavin reductase family protein [Merdibacter sp.]